MRKIFLTIISLLLLNSATGEGCLLTQPKETSFLQTIKDSIKADIVFNGIRSDFTPGTIIDSSSERIGCRVETYLDLPGVASNPEIFKSTIDYSTSPDKIIQTSFSKQVALELTVAERNSFGAGVGSKYISTIKLTNGRIKYSKLPNQRILQDAKNPRIQGCSKNLQTRPSESNFVILESFVYDVDIDYQNAENAGVTLDANVKEILAIKLQAELGVEKSFIQTGKELIVGVNGKNLSQIEKRRSCPENEKHFNVKVDWRCMHGGILISQAAGSDGFVTVQPNGHVTGKITIDQNSSSGGHNGVCRDFQGSIETIITPRNSGQLFKSREDNSLRNVGETIYSINDIMLEGNREIWLTGLGRRAAMGVFTFDFDIGVTCQP